MNDVENIHGGGQYLPDHRTKGPIIVIGIDEQKSIDEYLWNQTSYWDGVDDRMVYG